MFYLVIVIMEATITSLVAKREGGWLIYLQTKTNIQENNLFLAHIIFQFLLLYFTIYLQHFIHH